MTRRIKTASLVDIRERNGKEIPMQERPIVITVSSHKDSSKLVVIRVGDTEYSVYGNELIEAVKRGMVETHFTY
jgi:hypothetical protein